MAISPLKMRKQASSMCPKSPGKWEQSQGRSLCSQLPPFFRRCVGATGHCLDRTTPRNNIHITDHSTVPQVLWLFLRNPQPNTAAWAPQSCPLLCLHTQAPRFPSWHPVCTLVPLPSHQLYQSPNSTSKDVSPSTDPLSSPSPSLYPLRNGPRPCPQLLTGRQVPT